MMRRSLLHVFTLMVCMAFLATFGWAASTVLYETGFEGANDPSGASFALGNLDGQGGWVAQNATVSNAQAQSGSQSVLMAADSSIERSISGSGKIWIVGQYRGDGSAAENPTYPATPPAACIVHFSQTNGVQCLNGAYGSAGGSFVPASSGTTVSSSAWTEVALYISYATGKWDCLLNGAAYQTDLGFRDNISSLSGFKSLSGTESYFDSFRVISTDGDADGDGVGDPFEIANGSNPLDPASSPISLFDVDGDGMVTALDGLKEYRIAKGMLTQTTEVLRDANCDGVTNAEDGILIYQWATGQVPFLPVCK